MSGPGVASGARAGVLGVLEVLEVLRVPGCEGAD